MENNFFQDCPYFPEFKIVKANYTQLAGTILRVQHEGIWYQHRIFQKQRIGTSGMIDSIMKDVYFVMLYGKIDPKIQDSNGDFIYPVDKIQISERERCILMIN